MRIYHIASTADAAAAARAGSFAPPTLGADGFIHCSYAHQVAAVANARFRGRQDLVLMEIDPARLTSEVRDEDLAGEGQLFPHIYGYLPMDAVVRVHAFPGGKDGRFQLPATVSGPDRPAIFLPGASGDVNMWRAVADGLPRPTRRVFFSWPGFSGVPSEPGINGIDDLVARVVASLTEPCDLFAQSMGGPIALRAALQRPEMVEHLVLTATSGGLDVAALGGEDWRPWYLARYPGVPRWFVDAREDLTGRIAALQMPVLLLWGDADPISPVAVGRKLAEILPRAELVVIEGGTHDLVHERAAEILPHIARFLIATGA